mmetsp:Transcript_15741/g.25857  ORF Transcript_15741/g.25857 Transcript_15741/m.25857 type:complete len:93 (-) Transcript_15741:159-437(-)
MVGLHHGENSDYIVVHMDTQTQEGVHAPQRTLTLANYPSIVAKLLMNNRLVHHIMQYEFHPEEIKQSMHYKGNHLIAGGCTGCLLSLSSVEN